jgi:hypothetical protein
VDLKLEKCIQTKSETQAVIFTTMDGSSRLEKKSQEKKRDPMGVVEGRVPWLFGAGIAAAMAIVASAFNTDHPNMLEPTKNIPTGAEYVTLNIKIGCKKSQHIRMRLRKMVCLMHFCSVC